MRNVILSADGLATPGKLTKMILEVTPLIRGYHGEAGTLLPPEMRLVEIAVITSGQIVGPHGLPPRPFCAPLQLAAGTIRCTCLQLLLP